MAFTEGGISITFPVGAALAANLFVTIDSSGEAVAAGDGGDAIGIVAEGVSAADFTAGKRVATIVGGELAKVKVQVAASTAIVVGNKIGSDLNGNAIVAAIGDAVLGVALEAAGVDADQELITVLLTKESRLEA